MSGIIGGAGSKSGVIGTTELDYEEGEFTVAHAVTSGSLSLSSSYNTASYCRIGNMVTIRGNLYSTAGSGWGYLQITLPFVSANYAEEGEVGGGGIATYSVNHEAGTMCWELPAGGSTYVLFKVSRPSNSWGAINFAAGDYYMFTINYMTS